MVTRRRGRSSLGCLVMLLVAVAALYFAVNLGEVYLRSWRFLDAMRQEARFAGRRSDAEIARRLASQADSLGLPESAGHVTIRRGNGIIRIWSDYYDRVELPLFVHEIHFTPTAASPI